MTCLNMLARGQEQALGEEGEGRPPHPLSSGRGTGDGGTGWVALIPTHPNPHAVTGLGSASDLQPRSTGRILPRSVPSRKYFLSKPTDAGAKDPSSWLLLVPPPGLEPWADCGSAFWVLPSAPPSSSPSKLLLSQGEVLTPQLWGLCTTQAGCLPLRPAHMQNKPKSPNFRRSQPFVARPSSLSPGLGTEHSRFRRAPWGPAVGSG